MFWKIGCQGLHLIKVINRTQEFSINTKVAKY